MAEIIKPEVKRVLPNAGHFEIDNGIHTYRLIDKLAPSMSQDKLAEFYEKAKKAGNPLPLNSIQMMELLEDTAMSGDNELKNYVYDCLRNNWLNTLSRVIYNPAGEKDATIHNYGTSDAYSIVRDIVGKDGWIENIDNPNALESILKTKDINKLNEISNLINSTSMYFWRINSKKPQEKVECVVRFFVSGGRLSLNAGWDPTLEYPTFLVEQVK